MQKESKDILNELLTTLQERRKWAENGMYCYNDNTELRAEYQGHLEEVDEIIAIIRAKLRPNSEQ